ncbi:DUF4123 domain-containing protein [Litoreibacter janthinus]|nr:DUF4123 domain-containing protein [Litoreibacter janthinus]
MTLCKDDFLDSISDEGTVLALIEASVVPGLCETIEAEGLTAHCLFKGQLAEDLRDVAPYLVRLPKTSSILRQMLNEDDKPWALWDKRPGILIRSDMAGSDLVKHLRRFLRLHHGEKPFFFRFWEQASALAYFDAIASDAQKWRRWFFPFGGGVIDEILVPDLRTRSFRVFEAGPLWEGSRVPRGRFSISDAEMQALLGAKFQEDMWKMERLLRKTFPDATEDLDNDTLEKALKRSVSRMASFGVRQRAHVFRVAAWDLHSDGRFENSDRDGQLRQILEMPIGEADKMRRLAERLAELP